MGAWFCLIHFYLPLFFVVGSWHWQHTNKQKIHRWHMAFICIARRLTDSMTRVFPAANGDAGDFAQFIWTLFLICIHIYGVQRKSLNTLLLNLLPVHFALNFFLLSTYTLSSEMVFSRICVALTRYRYIWYETKSLELLLCWPSTKVAAQPIMFLAMQINCAE